MLSPSQMQRHLHFKEAPSTDIAGCGRWLTAVPVARQIVRPTYHLHLARWEGWTRVPLNLSEGEFVRPRHFFDLQLEGVFIGVMLHNVVVHVHQNPFFTFLEYFPNLVMGNIIFV